MLEKRSGRLNERMNETTALKQSPIMFGKIAFTDLLLSSGASERMARNLKKHDVIIAHRS